MAQSETKLSKPSDFAFDVLFTGAFSVFMFTLFKSHVPSNDPKMVTLWAGLSAACIGGVFWLATWMLRVVYRHQKLLKAGK